VPGIRGIGLHEGRWRRSRRTGGAPAGGLGPVRGSGGALRAPPRML